jgi:hypothetical protein
MSVDEKLNYLELRWNRVVAKPETLAAYATRLLTFASERLRPRGGTSPPRRRSLAHQLLERAAERRF